MLVADVDDVAALPAYTPPVPATELASLLSLPVAETFSEAALIAPVLPRVADVAVLEPADDMLKPTA